MFLFWYDLNLNLSKLSQLNNYRCGQSSESYKNYMSRYQPQILWKLLTSKNGPHFFRKTNDLVKNGEYDIWNNFRNDKNCIEITERGNALKKNFFYELMPIELVCCYFRFELYRFLRSIKSYTFNKKNDSQQRCVFIYLKNHLQ